MLPNWRESMPAKPTKTHYLTLRVVFDKPTRMPTATRLASESLKGLELKIGNPFTPGIPRAMKIARVMSARI